MPDSWERDGGDLVAVGRIAGPHGIRGELKVEVLTDFPQRLAPGEKLLLVSPDGKVSETRIVGQRGHKGRYLLMLDGVTDRTAAERLRGGYLKVRTEDLPPLPPGHFYQFQLVGLSVRTVSGDELGHVAEVTPTGSNLVLAVRDGGKEVLVPFIETVVIRVDIEAGELIVNLPEGLPVE
jgi:16S rRNA processing protein RimM